MKKLILAIMMVMTAICFAYSTDYTTDIKKWAPNNGQVIKNDGTLVNESDSIYTTTTTQALTAGALSFTTAFTGSAKVVEIEIVFSSAVTETVTITKIFADTNYNTVRKVESLVANTSFVFNDPIYLNSGQQIKIQCTNATATATARVTVTYSKLVR